MGGDHQYIFAAKGGDEEGMSDAVLDYINRLGASSLPLLYGNVCTCIAVLRCLPPLSRQILMRLAFIDQVTPPARSLTLRRIAGAHDLSPALYSPLLLPSPLFSASSSSPHLLFLPPLFFPLPLPPPSPRFQTGRWLCKAIEEMAAKQFHVPCISHSPCCRPHFSPSSCLRGSLLSTGEPLSCARRWGRWPRWA